MSGKGADQRRRQRRKLRQDCYWRGLDGVWQPRYGFKDRGARRAIERIYDLTGRVYVRYKCELCGLVHIKLVRRTHMPDGVC
jgi:hypothetical protein